MVTRSLPRRVAKPLVRPFDSDVPESEELVGGECLAALIGRREEVGEEAIVQPHQPWPSVHEVHQCVWELSDLGEVREERRVERGGSWGHQTLRCAPVSVHVARLPSGESSVQQGVERIQLLGELRMKDRQRKHFVLRESRHLVETPTPPPELPAIRRGVEQTVENTYCRTIYGSEGFLSLSCS